MAEKRRRQQELRAKFEQEYKPESPKPKVSFTPVVFDIKQEGNASSQ